MINIFSKTNITKLQNKLLLDNKKICLIILAFLLIVVFLDIRFLLALQLKALGSLNPKITRLKQDLDNLAKDLARIQELKNRHPQIKQKEFLQAKQIIPEGQITYILQQVSDIAKKNAVKIIQMNPVKQLQAAKSENSSLIERFIPLSLNLDLVCDYHHLGKFINDLEKGEIFMAVLDIKITAVPKDYLKQKASLALKTYVRK